MKFIIDADSPHSLVDILTKHGYEAAHVRDLLGAATDDEIAKYVNKNEQIIITRDLGFAETFIKNKGFGLIIVRLPYYFTTDRIIKVFEDFLEEIDCDKLVSSITVLELGRYRNKKQG